MIQFLIFCIILKDHFECQIKPNNFWQENFAIFEKTCPKLPVFCEVLKGYFQETVVFIFETLGKSISSFIQELIGWKCFLAGLIMVLGAVGYKYPSISLFLFKKIIAYAF